MHAQQSAIHHRLSLPSLFYCVLFPLSHTKCEYWIINDKIKYQHFHISWRWRDAYLRSIFAIWSGLAGLSRQNNKHNSAAETCDLWSLILLGNADYACQNHLEPLFQHWNISLSHCDYYFISSYIIIIYKCSMLSLLILVGSAACK